MVEIGKYNILKVVKFVDFGLYLDGGSGVEILLPARYINAPVQEGEEMEVFVYVDSEDRLIATTEHPLTQVGEFSYLKVSQVNAVGAFLEWGLAKDLLVPFREQKARMRPGGRYLVYTYLDDASKRIVASSKIDKFLDNRYPEYSRGDKVSALVYKETDIGYKAIIDNLFTGVIYRNEIFRQITLGETLTAYIKQVREDGKIDLTLLGETSSRVSSLADAVLEMIASQGGRIPLDDSSSPEQIKEALSCSKKDFKKALGHLYKSRKIVFPKEGGTALAEKDPSEGAQKENANKKNRRYETKKLVPSDGCRPSSGGNCRRVQKTNSNKRKQDASALLFADRHDQGRGRGDKPTTWRGHRGDRS